ncbi:MFS general substrate transporter [Auriculariales sp. MPI-PUGE-AT-0066]|nr:MFS general substrate transporter [Auriculariales sp. MPI-PUGE-AT-0066]
MTVCNLYYSHPLLIQLASSFGVSYTDVANIPTLTQAGYATGLLLIAPLGDLVPRRPLLLVLLLCSSTLSIGLAMAPNVRMFEGLTYIVGVFTVTPQILVPLAADLAPPERRATAMSIVMSGLLLGILFARVIAGAVADYTTSDISTGGGWRNVYWLAFSIQAFMWFVLWAVIPDWPAKNRGTGLTYGGILWTMAKLAVTEPLLVQCSIIGLLSSAVFTSFWVTLTFILGGPPYNYSTVTIGLFGLIGIVGVVFALVCGRLVDRFGNAWLWTLAAILFMTVFQAIMTGAGGIHVAAVIVVVFGLDAGGQMQQISNVARIYTISQEARARLNAVFVISAFIGQVLGTQAGTRVYEAGGWRASGGLSLGWLGAMLVVLLARGPRCPKDKWIGGWRVSPEDKEARKIDEETNETVDAATKEQ